MEQKIQKDVEYRVTFECYATDAATVKTAIEAKAFLTKVNLTSYKIGGLLKQTWGVTVKGKQSSVDEFNFWWENNMSELCNPPTSVVGRILKTF